VSAGVHFYDSDMSFERPNQWDPEGQELILVSSWLLALYTRFEAWLYLVAPSLLQRAVHQLRAVALDIMISAQHPMSAPIADRMDRLLDAYMLIISGGATTGQILAVLFVIAVHTAYVGLLMKSVHRRATIRPDTQ